TYDSKILTYKSIAKGEVLPNAIFDANHDEKDPGKLGIGFACGRKSIDSDELAMVEKDGAVLKLVFVVNKKAKIGLMAQVKLDNARLIDSEDKELPNKLINGTVEIVAPENQTPKTGRLGWSDHPR